MKIPHAASSLELYVVLPATSVERISRAGAVFSGQPDRRIPRAGLADEKETAISVQSSIHPIWGPSCPACEGQAGTMGNNLGGHADRER